MQLRDVAAPFLGAGPEGLVGGAEDGVGLRLREARRLLGLLEGARGPLEADTPVCCVSRSVWLRYRSPQKEKTGLL